MRALRRGLVVLVSASALVVALLPLTAQAVADTTAPVVSAVLATPSPVNLPGQVQLTATVTDTDSVIGSAQYKVDNGIWTYMNAVDGAFDELIEDVAIVFPAPPVGTHTLYVRGKDTATVPNVSLPVSTTLKVLARPSLSVADVTVTEGNGGSVATTPMAFKVTPSAASTEEFSVDYAVEGGTATSGVDFKAVADGTLTWAPGDDTVQKVTVQVIGDLRDEYTESLSFTLFNPTNASLADAAANGTILDDDPIPTLNLGDTSITEPATGLLTMQFRVWVTQPSGKSITVRYATANGTAIAGRDYVAKSGTLTIAAGRSWKAINVKVMGDTVREGNKVFYLHLFTPVTNARIGDSLGVGVIRNRG